LVRPNAYFDAVVAEITGRTFYLYRDRHGD
jgi:hypothetical protein